MSPGLVSYRGRSECADSLVVKKYQGTNTANYAMSPPLRVSTNSYMIQGIRSNVLYTYQVIAREEKGLLGVDYNRSPKTIFTTDKMMQTNENDGHITEHPNIVTDCTKHMTEGLKYLTEDLKKITESPGHKSDETDDLEDEVNKIKATSSEVGSVEIFTTNEPVMAKKIEYKGILLVNTVKIMSI